MKYFEISLIMSENIDIKEEEPKEKRNILEEEGSIGGSCCSYAQVLY